MPHTTSRWRRRLLVTAGRAKLAQHASEIALGIIAGIMGGLGAVFFRWLIATCHALFFDGGAHVLNVLGDSYTIVLPAVGGLLVGLLTVFLAPEAKGHGVPEIMEAIALRWGRIRARVAVVKSFASAICIGSGGSVGREGPIAQIGAALASTLAGIFKVPDSGRRVLVGCGAAAGIAATFNAPVGGAFFALELLLGQWTAEVFAPVVVASVTGAGIGRAVFGDVPAFQVPKYGISSYVELPAFLLLGILAAPVGVLFVRLIVMAEDAFEKLSIRPYLIPAVGGIIVGVIGTYDHTLYGVGYDKLQALLTTHNFDLWALLVLLLLKLVATSVTIGSGGSGGVFSPSLYVGGVVGAVFGSILKRIFPHMVTTPAAYALVAMAAVFAATSHAPITAALIVFELTADYRMILPLMAACGTSVTLSKGISRLSIYTAKLVRRGVHVQLESDICLLNNTEIAEAMTTNLVTIKPDAPVSEALLLMEETSHHGFPLVDEHGVLHGMITADDVRRAAAQGRLKEPVSSLASHELVVAFPNETLNDGLRKLGVHHVGRVPVVDPRDHRRILGIITRKDIIAAYTRALAHEHTHLEETAETELFE
ncbi:MAG: chloride channel protein [Armatimonadetes bacterium]|nr:chloride channel protein [Armatimonadota bacterium]